MLAVLVLAVLVIAAVSGVAHKKRWLPRLQAWMEEVPYKDMLGGGARDNNNPPATGASQADPNIAAMERRSEERV